MVGYQGLSCRSNIQRQSGTSLRTTQVVLASAPARWAIAVSEEVALNVGTVNGITSYKNVGFERITISGVNGLLNGIQNKRLDAAVAGCC